MKIDFKPTAFLSIFIFSLVGYASCPEKTQTPVRVLLDISLLLLIYGAVLYGNSIPLRKKNLLISELFYTISAAGLGIYLGYFLGGGFLDLRIHWIAISFTILFLGEKTAHRGALILGWISISGLLLKELGVWTRDFYLLLLYGLFSFLQILSWFKPQHVVKISNLSRVVWILAEWFQHHLNAKLIR